MNFVPLARLTARSFVPALGFALILAYASTLPTGEVRWREDADYRYLESNGLPTHQMMVGITAWQQQVPLPHDFSGRNAFRLPKNPKLAATPVNVKHALFTGAIAVAANGVPIFNPIKNDGRTDTFLAGELDNFGGHCGRADDYHYHIAPLHLEKSPREPIGWALDGFALYGMTEPDGAPVKNLDEWNGHQHDARGYHYHATKAYPYVNGGLRGEVTVEDDAITPQPRTDPVRPAGRPLRGARITGFRHPAANRYELDYAVAGETRSIRYSIDSDTTFTFTFVDKDGERTESYERRPRRQKKRP